MIALCRFFNEYSLLGFILFIIIIVVLTYYFKAKYYNFWTSQGLGGPTPLPFIGNTLDTYFYTFPEIFMKRANKYGRIYGIYEGLKPTLCIADPNLVKQVCVKDFHSFVNRTEHIDDLFAKMVLFAKNEQWKRLRKIISPTFSTGKIKRMKPLIDGCVRNATDYLESAAERKEELNLKQFWSRFTLEVIACCCFATEINSHKDPDNEFFKNMTAFFRKPPLKGRIAALLLVVLPTRIFKIIRLIWLQTPTTNYLTNVILHLLKQRRENGGNYNDFLQLLIEAENESDKSDSPLTETEILANCIIFFIAGYETTATLLHYCCYSLAMNPEIQEKLYDEVKHNIKIDEDIDYDTVNKMPLLDAVICETLRLFPPIVFNTRIANAEVEMGDTGIKLPAKAAIHIPVYSIHHDPTYYPEPEKFKPERFLGENRDKIDPYSYLPFGAGPRNCVAMRFALLEAKLAIIQSVAKFKFLKSKKTAEPKFVKFTGFLICDDIFVDVIKRK